MAVISGSYLAVINVIVIGRYTVGRNGIWESEGASGTQNVSMRIWDHSKRKRVPIIEGLGMVCGGN